MDTRVTPSISELTYPCWLAMYISYSLLNTNIFSRIFSIQGCATIGNIMQTSKMTHPATLCVERKSWHALLSPLTLYGSEAISKSSIEVKNTA